jgi:FkbM family methyltransferase
MNPKWRLGGISSSFIWGLIGGIIIGAIASAVICLGPSYRLARKSYAEMGEDLILASIFQQLKIEHPTYLDIGAWDPIELSNTYLLYSTGSRGVLVEPNPAFCDKLRRIRPGDVVLNVGLGTSGRTEADYYMFANSPMNTFSKQQADGLPKVYGDRIGKPKVIKMPLVPVNEVIAQQFRGRAPDLLSLDVEGLDLDILRSLDFTEFAPRVVCVETDNSVSDESNAIFELMDRHGYRLWGRTPRNAIFVSGLQ